MKTRNFRAGKAWDDAIATADSTGENFADRLREYVDWYSRQPGARAPRRPATAVTHEQREAFLKALAEAKQEVDVAEARRSLLDEAEKREAP